MKQNKAQSVLNKWEKHVRGDEKEFITYCFQDYTKIFNKLCTIYFNSNVVKAEILVYGDKPMVFISCSLETFLNYYNKTKITRAKKSLESFDNK